MLNAHVLLRASISAWIVSRCTLLRSHWVESGLATDDAAAWLWAKATIMGRGVTDVEAKARNIAFSGLCLQAL